MSNINKVLTMRELIIYNLAYFMAGSVRGALLLLCILFCVTVLEGEYYSQLSEELTLKEINQLNHTDNK